MSVNYCPHAVHFQYFAFIIPKMYYSRLSDISIPSCTLERMNSVLSLKRKTIHGLSWNLINNLSMHGVQLIIGVILARLLSPAQFGLIGMTAIFTAIALSFVDSGFSAALVRKKTCTQEEYSTVFFYNMFAGICLYLLLYFSSPLISSFFDEPQLTSLVRVLSLTIIILAVSQIQRTILVKRIDFKRLTIITVVSSILSGVIAIFMDLSGLGVWSLVLRLLMRSLFESILLWVTGHWQPSIVFNTTAFRELFGFGSKLCASSLLDTAYQNIYNVVIGKYFSAADLGFYSRARHFSNLVGSNISHVIQNVTYPVLSEIKDDNERLRANFKRLLMSTSLLSCYFSLLMAACSNALILTLIGEMWVQSIPYLQLLCFTAMLYPMHALNLNLLRVQGRSDLFLKLAIYKKILAIPTIIIGIMFGIIPMLFMLIAHSIVSFFFNSYYSAQLIHYSTLMQLRHIGSSLLLSLYVMLPIYVIGMLLKMKPGFELGIQVILAVLGGIAILLFSNHTGAVEIRDVLVVQFRKLRRTLES